MPYSKSQLIIVINFDINYSFPHFKNHVSTESLLRRRLYTTLVNWHSVLLFMHHVDKCVQWYQGIAQKVHIKASFNAYFRVDIHYISDFPSHSLTIATFSAAFWSTQSTITKVGNVDNALLRRHYQRQSFNTHFRVLLHSISGFLHSIPWRCPVLRRPADRSCIWSRFHTRG